MTLDPESIHLVTCARAILDECDTLGRIMDPFSEALDELTKGVFPEAIMGYGKPGWCSLSVMQKRLEENIEGLKSEASVLVEKYRDNLTQRDVERQKRIERSSAFMGVFLSVFSPLAFITGVYGMNFTKPDGTPGMPELSWGFKYEVMMFYLLEGIAVYFTHTL